MILLAATASTMFAAPPAAGATLPPKPSLESFPRASFSCEVEGHPDVLATVDIDPPARAVTFRFGTGPVHKAYINGHTLGDVGISNKRSGDLLSSFIGEMGYWKADTWPHGQAAILRRQWATRVVSLPACRVATPTSRANGTGRVPFLRGGIGLRPAPAGQRRLRARAHRDRGAISSGWSALAVARLALRTPERLGNVDAGRRAHRWRKT